MATRWLTDDEGRTWRNFSLMQLQLFALLGRELTADGLSYPDYLVLANLSDRDGHRARPVELGRELGWEKSRVSHHIARMERRGLVERTPCPTDQRGWFVSMTDAGRAAIAAAAPGHVDVVRRHFIDLLTPAQLETLDTISTTVLAHLPVDATNLEPPAAGAGDVPGVGPTPTSRS
ncbi:MAG: MarR family transcriptional regulator [Ilumatobacter sp.]|nr:MarR family transcriptional regulator [Ilumatobacter sp.]